MGIIALILFALSAVVTPHASGYEPSLYEGFGPVTWVGFAVALLASQGVLASTRVRSSRWYSGLVLLAGTYLVFFMLPVFRGYQFFAAPRADQWLHFSHLIEIDSTGALPETLFYPASHLLFTTIQQVTGLQLTIVQLLFGWAITLTGIFGFYVVGRRYFGSSRAGGACLLAATPLLYTTYHPMMMPWFYGLLIVPAGLAGLLLLSYGDKRGGVLLLIVALAIAFFHPLTLILFVGMVATHAAVRHDVISRFLGGDRRVAASYSSLTITVIAGAVLLFWHFSFGRIQFAIQRTVTAIILGEEGAATYAESAGETAYSTAELVVDFLIFSWGPTIAYLGVGALISIAIGWRLATRRTTLDEVELGVQFGVGVIVLGVFIFVDAVTNNPVRISQYAVFFATVLLGGALWHSQRAGRGTLPRIAPFIVVLIMATSLVAGGIVYDNATTTQTTTEGSAWLLEHESGDRQALSIDISHRMEGYLRADREIDQPTDGAWMFNDYNPDRQLPRRLGYDRADSIGAVLEGPEYLVTIERDMHRYETTPERHRSRSSYYSRSDRDRLSADPAVAAKPYANGEYEVWLASNEPVPQD